MNDESRPRFVLNRRRFMAGAGAFAASLAAPRLARGVTEPAKEPILLTAKPGTAGLLESTDAHTAIWGYGGAVPGPVLRLKQGQELWVRLKNELPQPTTIHWHGVRIDNAMDGVAGLTQEPVPPGETFDYRFTAPDAGTFWYHPHNDSSWEQVARGLYGTLIVEEAEPPDVDQDLIIVADDWLLGEDGRIFEKSLGSIHDRAHAGRLGNILTLNGQPLGKFPVRSGERVRVRLCNLCNSRILELRFEQLAPQIIALDGQPVAPYRLENETITLAPAQRADLLIHMTGEPGSSHAITEVSQSRLVAGTFDYDPVARVPERGPLRLPANTVPEPDMAGARKVDLVMTGGAMGQLERAVYKGETMSIRDLVQKHGMVWAFNGVVGMTDEPLFTARRGETIALAMVNDTRWPHAMHIHGHHFREAGSGKPWRDTILVEVGETRTVHFVADNPGKWMIHCHMLEHLAGGMGTWFRVAA